MDLRLLLRKGSSQPEFQLSTLNVTTFLLGPPTTMPARNGIPTVKVKNPVALCPSLGMEAELAIIHRGRL